MPAPARRPARRRPRPLAPVAALEPRLLPSLTVQIDYRFDANNFFNTQARRDLLQAAADAIAGRLGDALAAIVPGGADHWSVSFLDPATGGQQAVPDPVVPADTLVVFAGGRPLGGGESGLGGPGGFAAQGSPAFLNTVITRGQAGADACPPTDVGSWGGSVSFDTTGTNWFFGASTAGLGPTQTDFYSVAQHELGHVLGIGNTVPPPACPTTPWTRWIAGGSFTGPASEAANGGAPVPLAPDLAHWAAGTRSGGAEAEMTPAILQGTRKVFTPLDFAGLADLGWTVLPTNGVAFDAPALSVTESAGSLHVIVRRTGSLANNATVQVAFADGTARNGRDYAGSPRLLSFGPNAATQEFDVPILDDALPEATETFSILLTSPAGTSLGSPSIATVSILDDDPPGPPPGDFDGDRKTDTAVFDPISTQFFILLSGGGARVFPFGVPNGRGLPVAGDYDGDGKADVAVYDPVSTDFFILMSGGGGRIFPFGVPNGLGVPIGGDYDGDGKTDVAVYDPASALFFIRYSGGGGRIFNFGVPDGRGVPVAGDYDGDGRTDIAVYDRPSRLFFIQPSGGGPGRIFPLGPANGAGLPVAGDYDGDRRTDPAVYDPFRIQFSILPSSGVGRPPSTFGVPNGLGVPIAGDYDGDGKTDVAVYDPVSTNFFILQSAGGGRIFSFGIPNGRNIPIPSVVPATAASGAARAADVEGATPPARRLAAHLAGPHRHRPGRWGSRSATVRQKGHRDG